MTWISVKERYPCHNEKVKVKIRDLNGILHELECRFLDYEDYRSWSEIKFPENVMCHAKPTHWMPLPKSPL